MLLSFCGQNFCLLINARNAKPRNRPSFRHILMHLEIAAPDWLNLQEAEFFGLQVCICCALCFLNWWYTASATGLNCLTFVCSHVGLWIYLYVYTVVSNLIQTPTPLLQVIQSMTPGLNCISFSTCYLFIYFNIVFNHSFTTIPTLLSFFKLLQE